MQFYGRVKRDAALVGSQQLADGPLHSLPRMQLHSGCMLARLAARPKRTSQCAFGRTLTMFLLKTAFEMASRLAQGESVIWTDTDSNDSKATM